MKIAMYVPAWPPGALANGIVTYASHMIPALRSLGHDVFVLTSIANNISDPYLVDLQNYQVPLPFWNRALFKVSPTDAHFSAAARPIANAIKELVTKRQVEILEIEESFGLSYAVSKLELIPVCVRLHGPWFLNKRSEDPRRENLERRGMENAQWITSPSRKILDSTVRRYDLKSKMTSVFANPISLPQQKWSLAECEKQSILFVGRFDEIKGADLMVQAFGLIAQMYPQLKLTFVGQDHGVSGMKFLDYARSNLSSTALSRLEYKGELPSQQIADLRRRHFMTVCSSRHEVLPYSVLEAMSFGCPIVASEVGGIPEMIRSGENGITFRSQNVDELVRGARTLLDNPDLASTFGHRAALSAKLYNPAQIAARAIEIYDRIIQASALNSSSK